MTRVLMTVDAVGGVWTYALELARALVPCGVITTMASMGPEPAPDQLAAAAAVPGLELETSRFALEWMDPWDDVEAAGDWLLDLEARVRPHIIHLNGYAHGVLPWRAATVLVGHSCVTSWSEAVGIQLDAGRMLRYRQAVTRGLHAANWVVAPTGAMLDALQRHYGPLLASSVVANGRTAAIFAGSHQGGSKEPIVLTAGRMSDEAKNLDAVLAIESRLSWPLVVAGDVARPGGTATFLGRLSQTDLARWLARASIFVLPARYEPFGLGPLEAALAGCALVLGDIPSLREVWGDAATYVHPDDVESLGGAIEKLIADEQLRVRQAARARERALTYTPERMAAGYLRAYAGAVGPQHVAVPRTICA